MFDGSLIPDPSQHLGPWLVVLAACAVACLTDLQSRRIPNAMTLAVWLSGLAFAAFAGGFAGFGGALGASILLALPYVILFLFAGGGAGDAKLMAGVGAWLGMTQGVYALIMVALVGGLAGIAVGLVRGQSRRTFGHLAFATTGLIGLAHGRLRPSECAAFMPPVSGAHRIPYGVAIFLGVTSAFVGALLWHG